MSMHYYTEHGEFDEVKKLIINGHNVNEEDDCGWTPLSKAFFWNNFDIAFLLIKSGADVNHISSVDGFSELVNIVYMNTITNDNLKYTMQCIRTLVDNGARINDTNDKNENILTILLDNNNYDHNIKYILKSLITYGASINKVYDTLKKSKKGNLKKIQEYLLNELNILETFLSKDIVWNIVYNYL